MILNRTVLLSIGFCFLLLAGKCQTDVLTQHNDLARTGWNSTETQLNVSNVKNTSFGLLFKATVDDQIYAQPLIVNKVSIGGNIKNVVYVCTVNNSIYAIDADNGDQYWTKNITQPGMRPPNSDDVHSQICASYQDFRAVWPATISSFGIVGTPVIDKAANTMYVVARSADPAAIDGSNHGQGATGYPSVGFHQYLHAIDLSTGNDNITPVEITGTISGTAPGNVSGKITFDPLRQNQRAGLLLLNGVIYICYAAHCDWDDYQGWIFAYNASNLQQLSVFISTPTDGRGGIWMSGAAPAAENVGNGNIYLATGNSLNADPSVQQNRGESILKLVPDAPGITQQNLTLSDWFTPSDYVTLNAADLDFGCQVLIVPNTNFLVTGAKDSYMYVLDKTNLGKFDPASNHIVQKFLVGNNAQFHTSFAYFGGATKQLVYQFAENQILSAYKVLPGGLDNGNPMTGGIQGGKGACGSYMAVSSNGADETTGILWIANSSDANCDANNSYCPGILYAVNASDVSKQLWNSNMNTGDAIGIFAKTVCPTIANGKVYMATFSNALNVYGLLAGNPNCTTNAAINKTAVATSPTAPATNDASKAFDNNPATYWQSDAADNQSIYVDMGASYDICKVSINWFETGVADEYYLEYTDEDPTTNPTWNSVDHETGNTLTTTEYTSAFTGRYIRMRGITRAAGSTTFGIYEMKVYGQPSVTCAAPSGLTASAITANTAHISWTAVPNATGYNFSYQNSSIVSYITRNNLTTNSVDLSALSCGTGYNYKVQAICSTGTLSDYSSLSFNAGACTVPCNPLPTRHYNADIGDIGQAGSSCYNGGVYTIKGSGSNIGGVDDQFQFMYYDESGDQSYSIRVVTQDATNAANKAGVMVKQSLSNTSPFAFIGTTSASGAVFMYRITDGGPTITQSLPGVIAPYYVKIVKTGTKYAGFVSATGTDPDWQAVGTQVDLGFGTGTVKMGLAVTSTDNSLLSTATFDNSLGSVVLPITLVGFSAQNINNQYVSLHWTTSMEVNNDHFTVERSADGVKFAPIATVKAVGNSNVNQNYSIDDNNPYSGINFYRLKQYDLDGQFGTSQTVIVNFGVNAVPTVYPNPATDNITVATGKDMIRSVTLFTVDGKQVMTADNKAAVQLLHFNVSALADGLYMMEIKTDAKIFKQKLIKQ